MFARRMASWCLSLIAGAMVAGQVAAEDVFYRVPLADLKLTEGELPVDETDSAYNWRTWEHREAMQPRVELDGDGEAYFGISGSQRPRWEAPSLLRSNGLIAVRLATRRDITGSLYFPKSDCSGMVKLRFSIPASAGQEDGEPFYQSKEQHFKELLDRGLPGAAWFRHEARPAKSHLKKADDKRDELEDDFGIRRRPNDVRDTFDLFSGGRAIRENLQLDRQLRLTGKNDEMVDVGSIKGITIAEIDWMPLLDKRETEVDALAQAIPADQHVMFFPSFAAALAVADEVSRQGTPLSRLAMSRSEDELTKHRYERQLCLPLSTLARLLGPTVIDSVAVTGSDPYFFTGTDVALLFETRQPAALKTLLLGRAAVSAAEAGGKPISGKADGLAWSGFLSADRRVSCLIAELAGAVVVTNSPAQLAQLAAVKKGDLPALATLDEYRFFRQRYPKGDEDETALLFLSDATIRRWCGPKWRIAASRRLRYAAVMSELQARFLDDLVKGDVEAGPIHTDLPLADMAPREGLWAQAAGAIVLAGKDELRLDNHGVRSTTDGTLDFQTPIAELLLDRVTKAEAEAYEQWRDRYQSNWRWAFDPIALRLTVKDKRLAADLTVMPLIWGSDYRTLVEVARGAELEPASGDPHAAIASFILALNLKSEQLRSVGNLAVGIARVNPLDWLGQWIHIFLDDDPEFWQALAEFKKSGKTEPDVLNHLDRLPLGIHLAVRDPVKLTLFLTALRAFAQQTAPEMTVWESLTYRDEPYVKVGPSERARGELPGDAGRLQLYYAPSASGLIATFNEKLLQRALDRKIERREAKKAGQPPASAAPPWLGTSVGFQFDQKLLTLLDELGRDTFRQAMQVRSWGSLPILNEWHRRYPEHDSVKLHEEFWQTRLVCPGGGEYVWNDEWQTMESTVYGHPGQPKSGPENPLPLSDIQAGNFGLTFEKQGLRARAAVERASGEKPKR